MLRRLQGDADAVSADETGATLAAAGTGTVEGVGLDAAAAPGPRGRPPRGDQAQTAESGRRRTDRVIAAGAAAAAANAQFSDTAMVPEVAPSAPGPWALGTDRLPPDVSLVDRRRRPRPARTRSRATVQHLDLVTVIRVSALFWAVILVAVVVASVLLYEAADIFGSLPSIEKSIRTLFSLKSFTLHPGVIAGYTALGGLVIAIAGTVATIVFALIYNLIADVVGGVGVELESSAPE